VLSDLLWRHRSIRKFKPDPVHPDLITKALEDAIAGTSSSGNLNSFSVILTRDEEKKRKLWSYHFEQDLILQAPFIMTFCADWHRTREWLRQRDAKDNFNNFLGYHVALVDAVILAQSVALRLQEEGLGICYLGTTLNGMKKIGELLELPDTCVPITTLAVGWPNESPAKRDRLPLEALIHDEIYQRPSPKDIDSIYQEKEIKGWERYMSYPDLKQAAEERGITSLAQFYTSEIKYSPEAFARASEDLISVLRDKGFFPKDGCDTESQG